MAFNLETPTLPLDSVFFPSVVVCNMNNLRKSFILTLLKDPALSGKVSFHELMSTVDHVFVKGQGEGLTQRQEQVVDLILNSGTYDELFREFWEDAHSSSRGTVDRSPPRHSTTWLIDAASNRGATNNPIGRTERPSSAG